MAIHLNKINLIGNVGKDPELFTKDNFKKVNLSLATSDSWKDKNTGTIKSYTVWHDIQITERDELMERIMARVKKGMLLHVEGKMDQREWVDKEGHTRKLSFVKIGRFNGDIIILEKAAHAADSTSPVAASHAHEDIPF